MYVIDLASVNATVVSSTVIEEPFSSKWSDAVPTPIRLISLISTLVTMLSNVSADYVRVSPLVSFPSLSSNTRLNATIAGSFLK